MDGMANAGATVTVEWGYETHSITLTPKNWARVKSGKPLGLGTDLLWAAYGLLKVCDERRCQRSAASKMDSSATAL
jgi:hypothetical protein